MFAGNMLAHYMCRSNLHSTFSCSFENTLNMFVVRKKKHTLKQKYFILCKLIRISDSNYYILVIFTRKRPVGGKINENVNYLKSLIHNKWVLSTMAIQKVKNVCAYSLRTCFIAADYWFLVFSVMLKSCLI